MMPNLKEVKHPKTLMELFRMDHTPQYLIKDSNGDWKVGRIFMDFRSSRFGIKYNGEYDVHSMTREADLTIRVKEIYEIDELFDMIKDGR